MAVRVNGHADPGRLRASWLVRELEEDMRLRVDVYLLRAYYRQERTYGEIAGELGVSAATVGRWIRLLGLDFRTVAREAMAGRAS